MVLTIHSDLQINGIMRHERISDGDESDNDDNCDDDDDAIDDNCDNDDSDLTGTVRRAA